MDRYISSISIKPEQVHTILITRVTSDEGGRGIEWREKYKRKFFRSTYHF